MNVMDDLFYQLLRVAIGTQDGLSRLPSKEEWEILYDMATRQSLVGVCFAALPRLGADVDEGFARIGISKMLYLTWLGMAIQIQLRNEVLNQQCVELQAKLSADGIRSCILKGQGIATLYSEDLRGLRQSGDIDVWVSGRRDDTIAYMQRVAPTNEVTRMHTQLKVFKNTEVELHFIPAYLRCPWKDRLLQIWFKKFDSFKHFEFANGFQIPSNEFNLVFIALHIFRHLLGEGVGMRQLMDYYFVLRHESNLDIKKRTYDTLKSLKLDRFAGALMWACGKVFSPNTSNVVKREDWMICDPDERLGQMILNEIVISGNFGHHDMRKKEGESIMTRFWRSITTNMKFLPYFPEEVICTPLYRIWHKCWQLTNGYTG